MKQTPKHLNDEHMRLYEWSGLGDGMGGPGPERSKRTHAWHASYSVLAVLTTLLILNGCDSQAAAEHASEQVGQAAQSAQDPHLFEDATGAAAAGSGEPAGEAGAQAAPPLQQR